MAVSSGVRVLSGPVRQVICRCLMSIHLSHDELILFMRIILSWLLLCIALPSPAYAERELTREELEAWFEDDSRDSPLDYKISDATLTFLARLPDKPVPHSKSQLQILPTSADDGWVNLSQCYDRLDAVPDAQVVYEYKQLRHLRVTESKHIGKSWVQGQSVQLKNVEKGARLCVAAQVRIFYTNPDGSLMLVNGPFKRKFLDGYYPMHVTLDVVYPEKSMQFINTSPEPQSGFEVTHQDNALNIDALFEGELYMKIHFKPFANAVGK
jgi:hypothetical protein